MAVAYWAAVVSLIAEFSNDSVLQEARTWEDEEFLLFLLTAIESVNFKDFVQRVATAII